MGSISSIHIRKPSHNKVWTKFFGSGEFHKCPVCRHNYMDKNIRTIEKNYGAWARCRKISKKEGGLDHIDNLVPVCWECNNLVGDQNLKAFAQKMQYSISSRI